MHLTYDPCATTVLHIFQTGVRSITFTRWRKWFTETGLSHSNVSNTQPSILLTSVYCYYCTRTELANTQTCSLRCLADTDTHTTLKHIQTLTCACTHTHTHPLSAVLLCHFCFVKPVKQNNNQYK